MSKREAEECKHMADFALGQLDSKAVSFCSVAGRQCWKSETVAAAGPICADHIKCCAYSHPVLKVPCCCGWL